MGMIHKKSRTTGKRPRRTGEKVAQNTGIDFLAVRLGVVLCLPKNGLRQEIRQSQRFGIPTRYLRTTFDIEIKRDAMSSHEFISLPTPGESFVVAILLHS